jgi:hypothetical protein
MQRTIRPRRLFVTGDSRMSPHGARVWRELGALLAGEDSLIVVNGGLTSNSAEPGSRTSDRVIIDGMLPVLEARGIPPEDRIETVLPDAEHDVRKTLRFKEGRIRILTNRNAQARRFHMVHSTDVVVSLEGQEGTRLSLDVALAVERPVLPLPFGGGTSLQVWREQRDEIRRWFQLSAEEVEYFETVNPASLDDEGIRTLAGRIHQCLMRGFTQACFVIMRFYADSDPVFDQAIKPALAACGFQAWRTDRSVSTGDVVAAIRDGINHCFFAIADTTGDRPNVMYELGLAHATNKPVVLLRRVAPDGSLPPAPFDFQTQSIIAYDDDLAELRRRLEDTIAGLTTRSLGAPDA